MSTQQGQDGAASAQDGTSLAAALAAALWDTAEADAGPLPTDVTALLGGASTGKGARTRGTPTYDPYDPSLPPTLGDWTPAVTAQPATDRDVEATPAPAAPTAPVELAPPEWLLDRLDQLVSLEQRHAEHVTQLLAQTEERTEELVRSMLDPILLGLVRLADRMQAMADGDDETARLLRVQLVQILDTVGVTVFTPAAGETFDPRRHRGVGPVDTTDPGLAGLVARCIAPGWEHAAGNLVRVADVEVHRLVAEPGDPAAPGQDDQEARA